MLSPKPEIAVALEIIKALEAEIKALRLEATRKQILSDETIGALLKELANEKAKTRESV